MSSNETTLLLMAPICAAAAAYGLTWLARAIAPPLGFVDKPDHGRKRHRTATPLLGGAAVFIALTGTVCCFSILTSGARENQLTSFAPLILSGALFCLLGLWDDRWPLRARDKFLFQVLASLPFAVTGDSVDAIQFMGFTCQLGPLAVPFTIFWLVSCSNIVNLLDGLDGLAAMLGLVASLTIALLSARFDVTLISLILAGSLLGFLVHNWPPAKIFLGDAGSLTIGFLVGALSLEAQQKTTTGFMLALPLVVLSIPILDTSLAILRRRLTGRGIGEPDRKHIHHLLQDRGLSKLQTLLILAGLAVTMAGASVVASFFHSDRIAVFVCATVLVLLVSGRVFGVYELALVFRHLKLFNTIVTGTFGRLGSHSLLVRLEDADTEDREELWETIRRRVAAMGAVQLDFEASREHEVISSRTWSEAFHTHEHAGIWHFHYGVERGEGLRTKVSVSGYATEAAGQRFDDLFRVFDTLCRHWPMQELFVGEASGSDQVKVFDAESGEASQQDAAAASRPVEEGARKAA